MNQTKRKQVGPREILKAIRKHHSFLITSHVNLEGDALGSQIAMGHLIRKMGNPKEKKVSLVAQTPVPEIYSFLPGSEEVSTDLSIERKPQVVVTVDCPSLARIGQVARYVSDQTLLITLDHHVSNEHFGHLNWVQPKASSTGEMIYHLYKTARIPIDRKAAISLYTSIMTDTGSFAYSNTTAQTHRAVAELIDKGVSPYRVSKQVYESLTLASRKLLAKVLEDLVLTADGKVAYVTVTREMLEETGANVDDTDGFVNYARSIGGVEVGLLFREDEKPGWIKVSFRSKGVVDVNQVANYFGGGGHRAASGCLIKGTLEEAKRKVLDQVHQVIQVIPKDAKRKILY